MKRILLTGARAPVTLDLARHFHRAGHEVYLADSIQLPVAWPTRAMRRRFVVTPPVTNPARFVDDLVAIVRKHQIDLVIPTCEEIFYVAARLEALTGLTQVFAEPLARLEPLHNKWTFAQRVQDLGGPACVPETHLLASAADHAAWSERGDTAQWVFKPVYSRFAARTLIGPTRAELAAIRPDAADPWVAQRLIRGQEYSTYSVARRGTLRAHACYRSEYRAGRGSGIYFLPVERPDVRSFVSRFAQRQAYTGQIGFDFIAADDGTLYVLECNPRATSGLHLLAAESVADAFLQTEGPLIEPSSMQPAMLASVMLLYPLPLAVRQGRVGALCRDMLRARDVMFDWSDPWPALLAPLALVEVAIAAVRSRKPLTRAATFDIEWNGEPL